jgi:hypothetical protein
VGRDPGDGQGLRNQLDIVVAPREAFTDCQSFRNTFLFSDRLLCAVDADNEAVGEKLSLEQFSSLPYLATTCERTKTTAEAQLDRLGIPRNVEFSTMFGMVPNLLSGSRMIALVHQRLALALADQTTLRLLEPPMPLQPIDLLMLWTNSAETDPGHSWLRRRILSLIAELDGATLAGSRWLDGAQRGDTRGTGPEILLGYPGDEGGRVAAGRGLAPPGELQRVEAGSLELPGGGQRHVQDRA